MGGCGVGVHLYFTNGETEAGARGRVVPGWVVSVPAHARCRDSHRCPGGPAGARSPGDSRRQGPRAPTSHLGGSGRGGTQSERLWPPRSAGGSPSRAAAPRGLSYSRSPPNRKNPIRSSRSSSAAAPSARGRPRGSMAACGGAQGGERPRAAGPIAVPADPRGKQEDQPRAAGPDGCPILPPALSRHLTCSGGSGTQTFLFQKPAGGKGGGGAGQPREEQEPAPPPT